MLLADIKAVFDEKITDRLTSADMCDALTAREDRPWIEWRASKNATLKPLSVNQLARLLKPFGIAPTGTIRVGARTAKGYYRHQFEGVWQRYLAAPGAPEPSHRHNVDEIGTSSTFQTVTPNSDVTDEKCEKPAPNGHCDGVTVEKGGDGRRCRR